MKQVFNVFTLSVLVAGLVMSCKKDETDIAPVVLEIARGIASENSIFISGEFSGTGITEIGVVYSTSPELELSDTKIVAETDDNKFLVKLSELEEGTTYYYMSYASNKIGTTVSKVDSFTTYTSQFEVLSISVSGGNNSADLKPTIDITFNKEIDALSFKTSSFMVANLTGNSVLSGNFSLSGQKISYQFNRDLEELTRYIIFLKNDVLDTKGHSLSQNYTWQFVTRDESVPNIVSVYPSDNSTDVIVSSDITVYFSEAIEPSSVNSSTVQLLNGINIVPTTFSVDSDKLTITPTDDLNQDTEYTILITTGVTDLSGTGLVSSGAYVFKTERDPVVLPSSYNYTLYKGDGTEYVTINTSDFYFTIANVNYYFSSATTILHDNGYYELVGEAGGTVKRLYINYTNDGNRYWVSEVSTTSQLLDVYRVTGRTVKYVTYYSPFDNTNIDMYNISGNIWLEYTASGEQYHTETGRDDWSVYFTKDDGALTSIDINTKEFLWAPSGGTLSPIYDIKSWSNTTP